MLLEEVFLPTPGAKDLTRLYKEDALFHSMHQRVDRKSLWHIRTVAMKAFAESCTCAKHPQKEAV